jgi:hemerythrin
MFEWDDGYCVKIASIDGQHRYLFRTAGELHEAVLTGQPQASVSKIMNRLVLYFGVHFGYEERLLQEAHYPQFEAHKARHDELTRELRQFQEDLQNRKEPLTIDRLQFLKDWLVNHIAAEDQKSAPFVKSRIAA